MQGRRERRRNGHVTVSDEGLHSAGIRSGVYILRSITPDPFFPNVPRLENLFEFKTPKKYDFKALKLKNFMDIFRRKKVDHFCDSLVG